MLNPQLSSAQSPKRPFAAVNSTHPRRAHPLLSKSIPRHKRVKIQNNSDGSGASGASGERPSQSEGQTSPNLPLGESRESSSDQSAAKWFQHANENVAASRNKEGKEEGIVKPTRSNCLPC